MGKYDMAYLLKILTLVIVKNCGLYRVKLVILRQGGRVHIEEALVSWIFMVEMPRSSWNIFSKKTCVYASNYANRNPSVCLPNGNCVYSVHTYWT